MHGSKSAELCADCLVYREDIHEARMFLDSLGMTNTKILAKIETRQALLNFRGILATADGVVLSRQVLGLGKIIQVVH